ncbi:unnamed protein product [Cercopithifilaria johnstoni]|uniref:Uncharacterized protein n=1 Tax=Cercopithifilaria johnstoni TaxID=2874296 RepID=A0A8J2MJ71_9BILA|nr:unnamed protein product [Cercopithifilaria johnstoni]
MCTTLGDCNDDNENCFDTFEIYQQNVGVNQCLINSVKSTCRGFRYTDKYIMIQQECEEKCINQTNLSSSLLSLDINLSEQINLGIRRIFYTQVDFLFRNIDSNNFETIINVKLYRYIYVYSCQIQLLVLYHQWQAYPIVKQALNETVASLIILPPINCYNIC